MQTEAAKNLTLSLIPNPCFRGVSSTAKLSVSKTELGGSNPSAPAILSRDAHGSMPGAKE